MVERVIIIGATGNVGRTLVRQMVEKDMGSMHRNPTVIVGMASREEFAFERDGIPPEKALAFAERKSIGKDTHSSNVFEDIFNMIKGCWEPFRVIDVTASKEILDLHLRIIGCTDSTIVTANKNPVALSVYSDFFRLVSEPQRYGLRCSVMAGAEAVNKIMDLKDLGVLIKSIEGCFSGTLGFIADRINNGGLLSDALKAAVENGYTEPHPASDLDGSDVAKKILILARLAGHRLELSDVKISPFVPEEYMRNEDPGEFVSSIGSLDKEFKERSKEARGKGNVLRYVARLSVRDGTPAVCVGLEEVHADGPLGDLSGTLNRIVIKTDLPGSMHYSVTAPGAGLEITGQNVRRDLLYQIRDRRLVT